MQQLIPADRLPESFGGRGPPVFAPDAGPGSRAQAGRLAARAWEYIGLPSEEVLDDMNLDIFNQPAIRQNACCGVYDGDLFSCFGARLR